MKPFLGGSILRRLEPSRFPNVERLLARDPKQKKKNVYTKQIKGKKNYFTNSSVFFFSYLIGLMWEGTKK